MKMENYAQLLRYICTLGPNDFYFGLVADYILDDMRKYSEYSKHITMMSSTPTSESSTR